MGLYNRDYMKEESKPNPLRDSSTEISLWKRFLFRLWLLFHPRYWEKM
ncbi:MAG: hypothetical protein ACMUHX_06210 [bacterium]